MTSSENTEDFTQRINSLHTHFDQLIGLYDDHAGAIRDIVGNSLKRIHFLSLGQESSLVENDSRMIDYDLGQLDQRDRLSSGLVRAARFSDGVYMSFLSEHEQDTQYSLRFNHYNHVPQMTSRGLIYGGSSAFGKPIPVNHRSYFTEKRELAAAIVEAESLVEQEAESGWSHSFSLLELNRSLHKKMTITIRPAGSTSLAEKQEQTIGFNLELEEPYL